MKKLKSFALFLFSVLCLYSSAQVAITNPPASPDASAMLDVKSTTKGLLIPRMTEAQRTAIVNPATGLLVYQQNGSTGFYYNSGTPASPVWQALNTMQTGWSTTGNAGTDTAINFLGTIDNHDLKFRVNNNRMGKLTTQGSVFLGQDAGNANTAFENTGIGRFSLSKTTTGNFNTSFGSMSMATNTTGYYNTGLGRTTLYNNTIGAANTAVGNQVLYNNTTGNFNTGVGMNSLLANTTGEGNVGVGVNTLDSNRTGYSNVAIGISAMKLSTVAHNTIAIGDSALFNQAENSYGIYFNTAVGSKALYTNTTGSQNTALGSSALNLNVSGSANTAIGGFSLQSNTTGNNNTAIGVGPMNINTTGSNNTAVGTDALLFNVGGYYNAALGNEALRNNSSGFQNTGIGYYANVSSGDLQNATAIGALSMVSSSNSIVLGSVNGVNGAISDVNVGIGTNAPNHSLEIHTNSVFGGKSQLLLYENDNDFARMKFQNSTNSNFWDIAGAPNATPASARLNFYYNGFGDVLSLSGNGNVGIGTGAPAQKLDIAGNVNLTGKVVRPSTGAANLVPVAFGNVHYDATITGGTGNFSVTHAAGGPYIITITGEFFTMATHVATATVLVSTGRTINLFSDAGTGKLSVAVVDPSNVAAGSIGDFSFVVYKLN